MSFVPAFAPDALSEWQELEFDLQERVWDALEDVLNHPPARETEKVIDVVYEVGGARHFLFIRILLDSTRNNLTVTGVTHVIRPVKP